MATALSALLFAGAFGACDGIGTDGLIAPCELEAGDLVLTEILMNPSGLDSGHEWIEVYNASLSEMDLRGLRLVVRRGDSEKRHTLSAPMPLLLAPGGYGLMVSSDSEVPPLYVYGTSVGDFSNSGATISMACGDGKVLDTFCYGDACEPAADTPSEGLSWALVAAGAPDYLVNDGPLNWAAEAPTPGEENPERPVMSPEDCQVGQGALVITEIMPDPDGADSGQEWFEVYNAGFEALDIRAVEVQLTRGETTKRHTIAAADPIMVAAGEYAVVSAGMLGVGERYVYEGLGDMSNSGAVLTLACLQGALIDTVCYGDACEPSAPDPVQGSSVSFTSPDGPDAVANDDTGLWTFEVPTPGAANPIRYVASPEDCLVTPGALVVTEILPNPQGVDTAQEWLEVFNASAEPLDLRGVEIAVTRDDETYRQAIAGPEAILVPSGGYAVLASGDSGRAEVWSWSMLGTLSNMGAVISLSCLEGAHLDTVCYGDACEPAMPAPGEGRSFAYTAPGVPDPAGNDDPLAWSIESSPSPGQVNPEKIPSVLLPAPEDCEAIVGAIDATLTITEVFANPAGADTGREWFELRVDGVGACVSLDGVRIDTDLTSTSGGHLISETSGTVLFADGAHVVLADTSATLNGVAIGGFMTSVSLGNSEGTLGLWVGDTLVASAHYGDTVEDASAQWVGDGWCVSSKPSADLSFLGTPGEPNTPCGTCYCVQDGAVIAAATPAPGELLITEVMANTPGGETEGKLYEWFEVTAPVALSGPRSLACLHVAKQADEAGQAIENPSQSCLDVAPGESRVFGRSQDLEANGGVVVDVVYPSLTLNQDGTIWLFDAMGQPIDGATYGAASDGVSRQLDPSLIMVGDATSNDVAANWCDAPIGYNHELEAYGTPGSFNPGCDACFCQSEPGVWQEAPGPAPGDLVITEIFANTPGAEDADYEWLEVWYGGETPAYLNCVSPRFGDNVSEPLKASNEGCLMVESEALVVLCADAEVSATLGVADCLEYDGAAMKGTDVAAMVSHDQVLGEASWSAAPDGVSLQLAGSGPGCTFSYADADLAWCQTTADLVYASQSDDLGQSTDYVGTPGALNPCCGL